LEKWVEVQKEKIERKKKQLRKGIQIFEDTIRHTKKDMELYDSLREKETKFWLNSSQEEMLLKKLLSLKSLETEISEPPQDPSSPSFTSNSKISNSLKDSLNSPSFSVPNLNQKNKN
jgi:hypothetical protein